MSLSFMAQDKFRWLPLILAAFWLISGCGDKPAEQAAANAHGPAGKLARDRLGLVLAHMAVFARDHLGQFAAVVGHAQPLGQVRIVGEHRARVAERAQVLGGKEAERGGIAERPGPPAAERGADTGGEPLLVPPGARSLLVLEHLTDPDNVGAAFRNAMAFGVEAVLLSPGCADPLYRKAIRTSAGATLAMPFTRA
mgnify:CR=1 FL=1